VTWPARADQPDDGRWPAHAERRRSELAYIQAFVDRIIHRDEAEIRAAMRAIVADHAAGSRAERAVTTAALLFHAHELPLTGRLWLLSAAAMSRPRCWRRFCAIKRDTRG